MTNYEKGLSKILTKHIIVLTALVAFVLIIAHNLLVTSFNTEKVVKHPLDNLSEAQVQEIKDLRKLESDKFYELYNVNK